MHLMLAFVLLMIHARAEADVAGSFDYYVLSLSWSPNWCTLEGDARGSDQCDPRHDHGWILHGLWPQFETGYPSYCQTIKRAPTRRMTAEMADIMGTSGLAWHQWKKHGTCTNLEAAEYYDLSRQAYRNIVRPPVLRDLTREVRLAPKVVKDAFLEANPSMKARQITITCKSGYIQEARICLTKNLSLRDCGTGVRRDCTLPDARFSPIR